MPRTQEDDRLATGFVATILECPGGRRGTCRSP